MKKSEDTHELGFSLGSVRTYEVSRYSEKESSGIPEILDPVSDPLEEDSPTEENPQKSNYICINGFFVNDFMLNVLSRNISKGIHTLLLGPTGIGKTELVVAIAKTLNLPLTIIDMGTMTDPISSLVGNHTIVSENGVSTSKFVRSHFSEIIQRPGIVLLDEISRSSVQANNLLFPVLDFRKELAMEYDFGDTSPVKVHPNYVFIATANLGSEYTGTTKLDRALSDRFLAVQVDELPKETLLALLLKQFPETEEITLIRTVELYAEINCNFAAFALQRRLSIRQLKYICGLIADGFTPFDAFVLVYGGIAPDVAEMKTIIFSK